MDIGSSKSLLHLRVAIAPCLLGYAQTGLSLFHDPDIVKEGNPYWDWINLYASERFQNKARIERDFLEESVVADVPSTKAIGELKKIFRKVC